MDKHLWSFLWANSSGDLSGLFVATQAEIDNLIGKEVSFGEVLGKHSEVYGTIEQEDITKIDVHSAAVGAITSVLGETWCGYNPLHYVDGE